VDGASHGAVCALFGGGAVINALFVATLIITSPWAPPRHIADELVGPTTRERCEIRRDNMVKMANGMVAPGNVTGICREYRASKVGA